MILGSKYSTLKWAALAGKVVAGIAAGFAVLSVITNAMGPLGIGIWGLTYPAILLFSALVAFALFELMEVILDIKINGDETNRLLREILNKNR